MQEGQVRQDLYLGNLPTEGMTNNEIEALFVASGPIAEVVRPVGKSKNNEPKNFALREKRQLSTTKVLRSYGCSAML